MGRSGTEARRWMAALSVVCVLLLALAAPGAASAQVRQVGTTLRTGATPTTISSSSPSSYGTPGMPGMNDSTTRDTNAVRGLVYHKETPDSVLQKRVFMFRYRPTAMWIDEVWNPSLSPTGIQMSDRLDALNDNYYLGKGTVGHPHYAVYPTLADGLATALQPDPNAAYAKRAGNIWLYQTMTPFTQLDYHSSLDKDYQVRFAHTQNIRPGWNVAFDYDLICPEGVYTSSGAKNHYLDATTNYFSPDSRLQVVAGVIWQGFNIDENGGIADDSYFTMQLQSNRAGVPVNMYNNGTLHRETAAFARGSYNLVQQQPRHQRRDSIAVRTVDDSITVVDTVVLTDTIYPARPHVLNAGVVAAELTYDRRKRVFADSTLWVDRGARLFWTNDAYPDYRWRNPLKVTLGINPHTINATIDDRAAIVHTSLQPFANAVVAMGRNSLAADLMYNDGLSGPEYHVGGRYRYDFDSLGTTHLTLAATAQREAACVRMVSDARTCQGLELSAIASQRYEMCFVGGNAVDVSVRASHMSHNTWYDTALVVHQGTSPLWLWQAQLTTHLTFGWFHLDMQQLLQHSTDQEQLPVPLWASKNSVYAELHLFNRALTMQTGFDLRYMTAFHAPAYDYRTGLFVHQDDIDLGNYYWGDLFVSIQVKRASIYVKGGHVNALWEGSPDYFTLPHYPGRKFGLYWGITWKFFD